MDRLKVDVDLIGSSELRTVGLYKAMGAEFMATFCVVLLGCGSTLDEETNVIKASLTFGITLACVIQAFYHISGSHANPSVSVGMMVAQYMSITRTLAYVVAQCLGAVAAAGFLYVITPESMRFNMGVSKINEALSVCQAFGVEMLCTFVFVLTFFGTTDGCRTDLKGPISAAVGQAVTCTHMFGIPYTGASLNPARSFGPALIVGGTAWDNHWVYWAAPLTGGMAAALLYSYVFRAAKPKLAVPTSVPTAVSTAVTATGPVIPKTQNNIDLPIKLKEITFF